MALPPSFLKNIKGKAAVDVATPGDKADPAKKGENPFAGGGNPFGKKGAPAKKGENPFAGGGNPFGKKIGHKTKTSARKKALAAQFQKK